MNPFKAQFLQGAAQLWHHMPAEMRRSVLHRVNDRFLVGVVGLIHDGAGRVLLLEHRFRTPHRWGLPGGHIEYDESFEAALVREIWEEIGLAIEVEPDPRPFDVELNQPGRYISVALVARAAPGPLRFSGEIVGGGFYGERDLPPEIYPHHRAVAERFLAGLRARTEST